MKGKTCLAEGGWGKEQLTPQKGLCLHLGSIFSLRIWKKKIQRHEVFTIGYEKVVGCSSKCPLLLRAHWHLTLPVKEKGEGHRSWIAPHCPALPPPVLTEETSQLWLGLHTSVKRTSWEDWILERNSLYLQIHRSFLPSQLQQET
jgi:hypothetical protein